MRVLIFSICILFCLNPKLRAQHWNSLGPGLNSPECSAVHDMIFIGHDLYVVGAFTNAGGNPDADYIARWDGSAWHPVGGGLSSDASRIEFGGNAIYVCGNFMNAGGDPDADYLAKWDGRKWHSLGPALSMPTGIRALAFHEGSLYVGGWFKDFAGIENADHLVQWDGDSWHGIGKGLNDDVNVIVVEGEDIYFGGAFTNAGGIQEADHFVRLHERAWYAYPGLQFVDIYDIAVRSDDEIYVTGNKLLMKWDDHAWNNLSGISGESGLSLWLQDETVYAGTYNGLRSFDLITQSWTEIPGIQGTVGNLKHNGSHLFAAGWFYNASDFSNADNIARWGEAEDPFFLSGVPNLVCRGDPSFALPVLQQGISGDWSGKGVHDNIFYPVEVRDLVSLTFTPHPAQSIVQSYSTDISVFDIDSVLIWARCPPVVCHSDSPVPLFEYECPPGISGRWTGPGIIDGYFNPSGFNGNVSSTFTPDFTLFPSYAYNIGQCFSDPVWDVDVINFSNVHPIIRCDDNGTPLNHVDDRISVQVNAIGDYRDSIYTALFSPGDYLPFSGKYNAMSEFELKPGSAGGGDLILTLRDKNLQHCSVDFEIKDPGTCSTLAPRTIYASEKGKLRIFPNPTSGKVNYTFDRNTVATHTITIMDLTGQILLKRQATNCETDLTGMPSGVLLIKIEMGEWCETGMVIKYPGL